MKVRLQPFRPREASPEEWTRFHAFRLGRHRETDPEDPPEPNAAVEAWMQRGDPLLEEIRFAAVRDGEPEEVVGFLTFGFYPEGSPSYETRKGECRVSLSVLQAYRRRGIGRRLLKRAAGLAREHRRLLLLGYSQEEDGWGFLEAIGARIGLHTRESRLRLDDVDWAMVEAWAREGRMRNPKTSLVWVGNRIPEDLLEDYCAVLTEVSNDVPRGELEMGDISFTPEAIRSYEESALASGGVLLLAVTVEETGHASGLTEMGYWPKKPGLVHQFMTGVRSVHRGRGLGKWLKAAMLLRVRQEFPEGHIVVTDNATTNQAMLSINERLGFKEHRAGVWAQISLDALERYLGDGRAGEPI